MWLECGGVDRTAGAGKRQITLGLKGCGSRLDILLSEWLESIERSQIRCSMIRLIILEDNIGSTVDGLWEWAGTLGHQVLGLLQGSRWEMMAVWARVQAMQVETGGLI